jgi:hypothetical protein
MPVPQYDTPLPQYQPAATDSASTPKQKEEEGVWKTLCDKVKEQDTDMVEGYTSDIDSLLIFVSV